MGTTTSLAGALFTKTQQKVLALLFGQPDRSFYTKELIELTGSGSGAVQRELQRLTSSGLVRMTPVGVQKHYQANPDCPVYHELVSVMRKTVAVAEPIRQALDPVADRIGLAMIYGSVAQGTDTAASDIDLLVIADDLMLEELYAALAPVEATLGPQGQSYTLYGAGVQYPPIIREPIPVPRARQRMSGPYRRRRWRTRSLRI